MAQIAYGAGANSVFPSVYQDPKYPKDIVINGILFDTDTMTPKVGSNVMAHTGNYGVGVTKTWTILDDDDSLYFGIINNDDVGYQYISIFAPNYPYQARDIKTDGTHYNTVVGTQRAGFWHVSSHMWGRDWLEHPVKITHLNNTTNQYWHMAPTNNHLGSHSTYSASGRNMMWQNGTFRSGGANTGNWIVDPETSSGNLFVANLSSTTLTCQMLKAITYATETNLNTATQITLYNPTSTEPLYIHHLTKCNNGDHFFLTQEGDGAIGAGDHIDIIRYNNSSNSVTIEYNDITNASLHTYPMSIPSNVVYHQESGETTTSKKICYHFSYSATTFDSSTNKYYLIEMDVSSNTINSTLCTWTAPDIAGADDDNTQGIFDGLGPDYYLDHRIMSASQDINSQKYLFTFITGTNTQTLDYDRHYMILKPSAANAASMSAVSGGTWDQVLTASSKNVNAWDICPWCVAPLNVEHTLMMVYTKYSTHLVKFDTSTETLSEVWMDDETVFTEVMWMPSGKILTSQYDNSFAQGITAVDHHAPKPIHVWAQDLIYNVDISTSANYVEYAGSDISNTLTISAYDGTNSRVATDLTLQIIGPAVFDNSTTTKTVTTSDSADITETITIQDNGQIEVKVVEIQS